MMILLHHMVQNINTKLFHFINLSVTLTLLIIFSFLPLLKSRGCANNFFLSGGSCPLIIYGPFMAEKGVASVNKHAFKIEISQPNFQG